MPIEYRLLCFPKAFRFFSFFIPLHCLYSAYALLIISSLALSTFLCVHLCPNLPLSMTPFNSSRFLCYSVASFVVSTTSPKKPSTSTIIFIKCQNLQHMKKNIRYKGNTNNTFVIIFLKIKNSQRWYFA